MPIISPAMAVAAAISGLSLGRGNVPLMYCAEVSLPLSTSIYPVARGCILYFFTKGAAVTCLAIRYSGFRPEMRLMKRIASVFGTTCISEPGKRITYLAPKFLISSTVAVVFPCEIWLPPTKNHSRPNRTALATWVWSKEVGVSGSQSTNSSLLFFCAANCSC